MDQLEQKARAIFQDYFDVIKQDKLAFGISAPRLCSYLEELASLASPKEIGNLSNINFGECSKPDYIMINHNFKNYGIDLIMNRNYNDKYSIASFAMTSKVDCGNKRYDVVVASSEIARNMKSSVYDFAVKIRDGSGNEIPLIRERYAMENRNSNANLIVKFVDDLRGYLRSHDEVDNEEVTDLLRDRERSSDVYFADTSMREIKDENFSLVPEADGFDVFCKGSHGDKPVFYHNSYDAPYIHESDADVFEELYEEDVFNILHAEGSIQDKLDICMMIFDNKQKLEEAHPVEKVTY